MRRDHHIGEAEERVARIGRLGREDVEPRGGEMTGPQRPARAA